MTAVVSTDVFGKPVDPRQPSYLTSGKGVASWLLTLDHKRIAILYMVTILAFFSPACMTRLG